MNPPLPFGIGCPLMWYRLADNARSALATKNAVAPTLAKMIFAMRMVQLPNDQRPGIASVLAAIAALQPDSLLSSLWLLRIIHLRLISRHARCYKQLNLVLGECWPTCFFNDVALAADGPNLAGKWCYNASEKLAVVSAGSWEFVEQQSNLWIVALTQTLHVHPTKLTLRRILARAANSLKNSRIVAWTCQ
jgi:hypothetical protein